MIEKEAQGNSLFIIGSLEELPERSFPIPKNDKENSFLTLGKSILIGKNNPKYKADRLRYDLKVIGEYAIEGTWLRRINYDVLFVQEAYANKASTIQNITEGIEKYGEIGFYLNWSGDIDGDHIPDLVLSQTSNHGGTMYFFLSSEAESGKLLKLVSEVWSWCGC